MKKTPQDYTIPELEGIEHTFSCKASLCQSQDPEKSEQYAEVARKARAEINRQMSEAMDVFLPSKK